MRPNFKMMLLKHILRENNNNSNNGNMFEVKEIREENIRIFLRQNGICFIGKWRGKEPFVFRKRTEDLTKRKFQREKNVHR